MPTVDLGRVVGPQGEPGKDGIDGTSFTVLGRYDTLQALQSAHQTGKAGDAWAVGTENDNVIYIWDTSTNQWKSVGSLQGPPGPQGLPGADGVSLTVSFSAIAGGNKMTVTDTNGSKSIDILNGRDGAAGTAGPAGEGVPTGGDTGQILAKKSGTNYDTQWIDAPSTGVTSFKTRTGAVSPQIGDYTAAMVGAIPADAVKAVLIGTEAPSTLADGYVFLVYETSGLDEVVGKPGPT